MRLKEFRLFENLWKETLLLFYLRNHSDKVVVVKNFGQLPQNLIYREVEEHSGITLEQYINSKFTEIDFKANDTTDQSQKTVISEVKAIDLILKVISLTDLLHSNQIIHTNLCPEEIFLRGENVDQMCFANLYHAHWSTK